VVEKLEKIVLLTLVSILLLSTLLRTTVIPPARANRTWTVDDDGPADFHTIEEALAYANHGDTIYVKAGIYYERIVILKDDLRIIGENKNVTIIDGSKSKTPEVVIGGDNVLFSRFTVRNHYHLILIGSYNSTIIDNIILNNSIGVDIGGDGNVFKQNVVTANRGDGFYIRFSDNNTICNNTITRNGRMGIWLGDSFGNTIIDNRISESRYGIMVSDSSASLIARNSVFNNSKGIELYCTSRACLGDNNMSGNEYNFGVYGKSLSQFIHDIDSSNKVDGKKVYYLIDEERTLINQSRYPDVGFLALVNSTHVTVEELNLTKNEQGILLAYTNHTIVENITVSGNLNGIHLAYSNNSTVKGNLATKNQDGVYSQCSNGNVILENIVVSNKAYGMKLDQSSDTLLKDNDMTNNRFNIGVYGTHLQHFIQDIDTSNTVNGKPVYYWVNRQSGKIPTDAGYVAVVNSTSVVVKDLYLSNNGQGVLLAYTTSSFVENVAALNNSCGIHLQFCHNNVLKCNKITPEFRIGDCTLMSNSNSNVVINNKMSNGSFGIQIVYSNNNTILENSLTNNREGIELEGSSNNLISRNIISQGHIGISLGSSNNNSVIENTISHNNFGFLSLIYTKNLIYHNNFINNTSQVSAHWASGDLWDGGYPSGGNYWSNYPGVDLYGGPYQNETGSDGIGDTPHIIEKYQGIKDNYPLMGIFYSFNTSLGYSIYVISNSTIEDFEYFNRTIKMYVSNITSDQRSSFCRLCIPHALMNVENLLPIIDGGSGEWGQFNNNICDNRTHRWVYFAFEYPAHKIEILPEFPSFLVLSLFIIATLLTVLVYRWQKCQFSILYVRRKV
jgi:parallel beta-helix repeat protein